MAPTPVLLPGKSHGRRSLVGCSPWGRQESDTTEQLHFHFSLSCIGEGNGNPLQCSCLENPKDGGAWWASVYGVAQSQTRLKQLSSRQQLVYSVLVSAVQQSESYTFIYSTRFTEYLLCARNCSRRWRQSHESNKGLHGSYFLVGGRKKQNNK